MFTEEIGAVTTSSGTSSSGKSTKILNGVNQYSLKAYSKHKIMEDVSDIFKVLDSNKNITTKYKHWKTA